MTESDACREDWWAKEPSKCDFPDCGSFATLIMAFTCGHHLCKTHEYFWTPECPACAQAVPRRITQVQADAAVQQLFIGLPGSGRKD